MNSLLNLYLKLNHRSTTEQNSGDQKDIEPSFMILHDGRYQSLTNPFKRLFRSEVSVTELPCPNLNIVYHYLTTKNGADLGFAVRYFDA